MSERNLALFLQHLSSGELQPVGAVRDHATLQRLAERPAPPLAQLTALQVDRLLASWPAGLRLRPGSISSLTLWVGAALNNLAWALDHPDRRLLNATLRLARAIPVASSLNDMLAYHSLLRHLDALAPPDDWQPVASTLLERCPLAAAFAPRISREFDWAALIVVLDHHPVRAALRDRILSLPHAPGTRREIGRLLAGLLEHGGEPLRHYVLSIYEADCFLQRESQHEGYRWPLLEQAAAMRASDDALERRSAGWLLSYYRPLVGLLREPEVVRPYVYLDARFLTRLADLLPGATAPLQL